MFSSLFTMFFLVSAQANSPAPLMAQCSVSYFSDSYAMGIGGGYKAQNRFSHPKKRAVDRACLTLGYQYGFALRGRTCSQANDKTNDCLNTECAAQMREGLNKGFALDSESTGTECYRAGYVMGVAKLDFAARENDAAAFGDRKADGKKCGAAYLAGFNDGIQTYKTGIVHGVAPSDRLENHCYSLGYNEWQYFWSE